MSGLTSASGLASGMYRVLSEVHSNHIAITQQSHARTQIGHVQSSHSNHTAITCAGSDRACTEFP